MAGMRENALTFRPPTGNPRFPYADSVRGVAAGAIVVFHLFWGGGSHSGGTSGPLFFQLTCFVEVFFVLSGFLLFRPYVAARAEGRAEPTLRAFALRRVLRIVPAYWIGLTVLAVALGARYVPDVFTHHWWIYYGFGQLYSPRTAPAGLLVVWSLCVEVTFYAMLPAFAAVTRRATNRLGWYWGAMGPVVALGASGLVVRSLTVTGVMPPILTRSLIGQTHFFAVGLALAVVSVSRSRHPERHRGVLVRHPLLACLVALGAFVAAGTVFGVNQPFSLLDWLHSDRASAAGHVLGNDLLVCLMAAMLISVAVFSADQSRLARATFGSRPLMFLG
ncbi:MAG: hypothetical protein QOK31_1982, partial [Solirubrobacteraceae bacterium]|nr:hypothetical protein [Solirubrobacteraceae bacterium]